MNDIKSAYQYLHSIRTTFGDDEIRLPTGYTELFERYSKELHSLAKQDGYDFEIINKPLELSYFIRFSVIKGDDKDE